jgi:hypothetical protein
VSGVGVDVVRWDWLAGDVRDGRGSWHGFEKPSGGLGKVVTVGWLR